LIGWWTNPSCILNTCYENEKTTLRLQGSATYWGYDSVLRIYVWSHEWYMGIHVITCVIHV
jgi:hypothetical protein